MSWLVVTEKLRFEQISAIRVVADPRRGVLGPKRTVLEISRRDAGRVLIFARSAVLHALYERVGAARSAG